jgi:hypothetical protein
MENLALAFGRIVGQKRVWPLYSEMGTTDQGDWLLVPGFVAARVVDARAYSLAGTGGEKQWQVVVTLQPTMLITATAVTDAKRRDQGVRCLFNPYVCKVRLVE